MIDERGLSVKIEVDGGINASNVKRLSECGVDIFVCGSAVFEGDITENMKKSWSSWPECEGAGGSSILCPEPLPSFRGKAVTGERLYPLI